LEVDPKADVFRHVDRWGTNVDTFGIVEPHDELIVAASASVETKPRTAPDPCSIDDIRDVGYRDGIWEFLQPTAHTRWGPGLSAVAHETVDGESDFVAAVRSVESLVHGSMDYQPGSTEIGVDVEEVWVKRAGVCQDFAHLTIALLRTVGIGARYVSGYFYAADPTTVDEAGDDEIVVATHAWVEVACPDGSWWALDPTNAASVGERHIKIGHGRDYDDVTPLRGVYYGETGHVASAEVTMSTGNIIRRELPVADMGAIQELQQQ
jgi:transglutaminase-like putative cysteine protease